jgi:MFS family permease
VAPHGDVRDRDAERAGGRRAAARPAAGGAGLTADDDGGTDTTSGTLSPEERTARRWRRFVVDTTAFRVSHDFRLLLVGGVVNRVGSQLTLVALPTQMYLLTGSPLLVGLLGLVEFVPFAVLSLFGGAVADRYDRRYVLATAQAAMAVTTAGLAAVTFTGHTTAAVLFAFAAVAGAGSAFDGPVRTALEIQVIPREHIRSAVSLGYGVSQVSQIAGPAIGGLLIAWLGFGWAYALDAVSFLALVVAALRIRHRAPGDRTAHEPVLRSIVAGLRFALGERALFGSFVIDIVAMTFGMPKALFPILSLTVFDAGVAGTGFLLSALAAGAMVAALTSGWLTHVRRLGRIVVVAVVVWGLAVAVAGVVGTFAAALVCFAIAGAADSVSAVCRSTILQVVTTEEMRGRMSALFMLVVGGGPYVGDVESGAAAALLGVRPAVVSGGLLSSVGAVLVAVLCPQLYRFDSDDYRHPPEPGDGGGGAGYPTGSG